MIKINLDKIINKKNLFKEIILNSDKIIIFYNSQKWLSLNKSIIFELIIFIKKINIDINYFFYNIPFCLFEKFWRKFIDKHCIRNRLCNYYEWYTTYNKCNICMYWLFCNNFNKNIPLSELNWLNYFKQKYITKKYLLNILNEYKKFFINFWLNEEEIIFYITQKYIIELLDWDIKYISIDFLSYLTIYFLIDNKKQLNFIKKQLNDEKINNDITKLLTKFWVNFDFTLTNFNNKKYNLKIYNYKSNILKIDNFYSRLKYDWKRKFFDFTTWFLSNNNLWIFKWNVFNKKNIEMEVEVSLIKKAADLFSNNSKIYMWRDLISWISINNYQAIIISSDWLWDDWRLIQKFDEIKIPVIYNIEPDFNLYLKNWDKILINFYTWEIKKL